MNTNVYNSTPFNTGAPIARDGTLAVSPFRFEVWTRAGSWLANALQWRAGTRTIAPNAPDQLTIEIPGDDECAGYLTFPNEIWMWLNATDGSGTTAQKFKILARRERRGSDGHWITIEAESLMGDLGRELVTAFATPVSEDPEGNPVQEKESITDILQDLLAAQTQSPIIRLGNVDSAIGTTEISISFENKSILECIEELRKIVGGFYYVDVNRFLHWKRRIGNDAGHWLRLDHNMSSVEVYQDFRQVKTRYIGYGAGISNDTRLSSEQNDATAQSSYGVIVGAFSQQRVNEQDTLDAMTEAELARWSAPATSYRIGVVDLSQVDSDRYSFEALMLVPGTRVNVICDAPAVDIVSRVRSVKWDLTDPAHVEVEFSDPESGPVAWGGDDGTHEPDVVDRIVDLVKRAEDAVSPESVAVGIARSMDPATDDVTDILTRDNYAGREAEDLAVPYGTAGNEDVDEFSDAMIDRIIDAKTDPAHPLHDTLEDAFGTLGIYWLGEVLALPAVPAAEGMYVCKWVSTGLGTGNDKLWTANGGDDRWTCMQVLTSLSGTPV